LTGNEITDYFTRFPEAELVRMAEQINQSGIPLLTAHVTNDTPIGRFYTAEVTAVGELRYLDTYAYWLADDEGNKLAREIDAGIIGEASIGFFYERGICSIDGGDWYDCGHWPGETYTITDPDTEETREEVCFVWMLDCEAVEGSIAFAGAHPNTRVGGTFAVRYAEGAQQLKEPSPEAIPTALAPPPTYFQLAAAKDMAAVFRKAKPKSELGKPQSSAEPETPEEVSVVKLKLKLPDGSVKELEAGEVQGVLDAQLQVSGEGGEQRQREAVAAALGLEPKDVTPEKLGDLAAQAKDGEAYRKDLEARLSAAAVTVEGQGPKAERIAKLGKKADTEDLKGLVEDWEAKALALVPGGRLSGEVPEGGERKEKPDLDAV
jgi:hypothetical protein